MGDTGAPNKGNHAHYRQAIVVVHGMGSQRPLDSSLGFIETALVPVPEPASDPKARGDQEDQRGCDVEWRHVANGERRFFSIPDHITGSYDSRILIAPRAPRRNKRHDIPDPPEVRAQTDFYEYHWAHLMQGNRLGDLLPTMFRLLFTRLRNVPYGITLVWLLCWAAAIVVFLVIVSGVGENIWSQLPGTDDKLIVRLGASAVAIPIASILGAAIGLMSRVVASSFVDVARYLDTSPRSYAVRREIRQGLVHFLRRLHEDTDVDGNLRYRRIIIVAHSLGAFIAYDGIAALWGQTPRRVSPRDGALPCRRGDSGSTCQCPYCVLDDLEAAADALHECDYRSRRLWASKYLRYGRTAARLRKGAPTSTPADVAAYQDAQRRLWHKLVEQDSGWRISDLVTVGTPMYFADRLMHRRSGSRFIHRVARREFSVCPPVSDGMEPPTQIEESGWLPSLKFWRELRYTLPDAPARVSYETDRAVLHQGSVFSVVRWSNCYFPARWFVMGDWFGGPVSMLFGYGINDIAIMGNLFSWKTRRSRRFPGVSHAWYYRFPDDNTQHSVARTIRDFLDLHSGRWDF